MAGGCFGYERSYGRVMRWEDQSNQVPAPETAESNVAGEGQPEIRIESPSSQEVQADERSVREDATGERRPEVAESNDAGESQSEIKIESPSQEEAEVDERSAEEEAAGEKDTGNGDGMQFCAVCFPFYQ